jgi:hypothetical protein
MSEYMHPDSSPPVAVRDVAPADIPALTVIKALVRIRGGLQARNSSSLSRHLRRVRVYLCI